MVAAELQDSLLVVMHDLHRLEGLLNHATDNLLERFGEANAMLTDAVVADSPELVAARTALRSAVTELQFQDMASQLIWHTTKVLQGCAFRLASEAMGHEEGEDAGQHRGGPLEATELVDLPRLAPLVDPPDEDEQGGDDQAVVDHLQDATGDGLGGQGERAQGDEADVSQ